MLHHIRLIKFEAMYSKPRAIRQICLNMFDSKRYQILVLFCLFTIPMIVLFSNTSVSSSSSSSSLNLKDFDVCSTLLDILYNNNRSLCSEQADRRGNKQRVISLSVFGPKENKLFRDETFHEFITPLLQEAKTLFPSWTVRLYTDEATINRLNIKNISSRTSNFDICNVNQLPILGNVAEYLPGKLWRFLPALDPMVDFVSSRDLDSPLIEREQAVVEQFINSSYIFLSLRDHPEHGIPVLGGMWSAALCRSRLLFLRLFSVLVDKNKAKQYDLANDQTLLKDLVWPNVINQTLVFDSYTCGQLPEGHWRPYPTQRESRDCHIGCVKPCCQNSSKIAMQKPCPEECRPKEHRDWLYC